MNSTRISQIKTNDITYVLHQDTQRATVSRWKKTSSGGEVMTITVVRDDGHKTKICIYR